MDMLEARDSLPDDAAELKVMVVAREAEIAAQRAEIRTRDLMIEKLKHQLAGMRRYRFGAKSEALDQLDASGRRRDRRGCRSQGREGI